ncbi:MAG: DUF3307 domain-containing protein [Gammaproteobacteria bacterium]|nr:DUF3307 domain-containing protein [Gammaproteobacteria bacterium]MDP2140605.1 DUF3307 domain-containing protein [Gammaproteobacteria bacterium]MDP2347377.1 DUF3307 domain-containing protein [Gammaproteobacteria bacterium]
MPGLELFFKLLVAHAAADFVLQSEAMSRGKDRHSDIHHGKSANFPKWYYWLTAHALIHGGMVYLVTNSFLLGAIETVSHWSIDFAKGEGLIGFNQDQTLHIGFKIGYVLAV